MTKLLKKLCEINGVSGDEAAVRDFIIKCIDGFAEWKIDNSGNIIAFKKGENRPRKKIMIDAHMDEVGFIISSITPEGFLKFRTVGGIKSSVLLCRRVTIGNIKGVIGMKPIHLTDAEEAKKLPKEESLYIDIGATSKAEAEKMVSPGDTGVIDGPFEKVGDLVKSKAIDDRAGCAILIKLLTDDSKYDFYATFTCGEEVGTRGAKTASYSVDPDAAIILEATTASDLDGVPDEKKVCRLSHGTAVSFMDCSTVYDREYYLAAMNSGIACQPKASVSGGNNAASVHLSGGGVRTIALSVPCRYIHSPSCIADEKDIISTLNLAKYMIEKIGSGEIQ